MTHRAINIDQFSSERIFEIDQVIWNAWWLDPMAGPAGRQHAARRGIGRVQAQWFIFADILRDLASTVARIPKQDVVHRDQLTQAVAQLHAALASEVMD